MRTWIRQGVGRRGSRTTIGVQLGVVLIGVILTSGTARALPISFSLDQTYLNPTPHSFEGFGQSVAAVGGNVLIGAYQDDSGGFVTRLSGIHEVPDVITDAKGTATVEIVGDGTMLTFEVEVCNIVGVTQAHIHFGDFGTAGPILLFLYGLDPTGAFSTVDCSLLATGTLTPADLIPRPEVGIENWDDFLRALHADAAGGYVRGLTYVNVHTLAHPTGEIRGQLVDQNGAAYLFDTEGNLLTTIPNPTPSRDPAFFGWAVAGVGGSILVTAPTRTPSGAVYLFATDGALLQTFLDPNPAQGAGFGYSVAAVGGNVLIGDPGDNAGATSAGAAYLFATDGTLLRTFFNPSPDLDDVFGWSVAGVGGNVLIGAIRDDPAGTNAGAAYLFDTDGNLLEAFLSPSPTINGAFGWSVAAAGGNVLVGAPADAANAGAVYLFAPDGTLLQTFLSPNPDSGRIGFSVAAVGGDILIGNPGGAEVGAAHLSAPDGTPLQTFLNPNPDLGGGFGHSVAAVGSCALIGNPGGAGAAYLFCPRRIVIPTFTDVALPVVAVTALLLLLNRRWKRKEDT